MAAINVIQTPEGYRRLEPDEIVAAGDEFYPFNDRNKERMIVKIGDLSFGDLAKNRVPMYRKITEEQPIQDTTLTVLPKGKWSIAD